MTILFESPNVFYAVIDGVNIRIDNPEMLNAKLKWRGSPNESNYTNQWGLKNGQVFQVEGFEYEVTRHFNAMCNDQCEHCKYHDLECSKITKVSCILKLAKEEEPKEKIYTIDEVIHKLRLGLSEYGKKSGIAGYWVLEDNVYYILNKLKK